MYLRRDFDKFSSSNNTEVMKFGIYLEQLILKLFTKKIDILHFKCLDMRLTNERIAEEKNTLCCLTE